MSTGKGRSHTGGYFFLRSMPTDGKQIRLNGNIHITCTILKLVAVLATESEVGALFLNTREAKILRLILHELGKSQPPTPIHVNNTTAVGIVNNTIKHQRLQAFEMRYLYLLDQAVKKYFIFKHQPGQKNVGDYPTKHHTAAIHQDV